MSKFVNAYSWSKYAKNVFRILSRLRNEIKSETTVFYGPDQQTEFSLKGRKNLN